MKRGKIAICVICPGRVELPTASVFAKAEVKVMGADINKELVKGPPKPRFSLFTKNSKSF